MILSPPIALLSGFVQEGLGLVFPAMPTIKDQNMAIKIWRSSIRHAPSIAFSARIGIIEKAFITQGRYPHPTSQLR